MSLTDPAENLAAMRRGDLYYAFAPELVAERRKTEAACENFNAGRNMSRRQRLKLWREVTRENDPLPPPAATLEEDEELLVSYPWVNSPVYIDYGYNLKLGEGVFINWDFTAIDTCTITVGARTLFGPHVGLYAGTHPMDPLVRQGTEGPELGKEIVIGEDCWIAANVIVLPGVTIGRGAVVGAGSVVTKDVPEFHLAAGNPARIIKRIETKMDPAHPANRAPLPPSVPQAQAQTQGAEVAMGQMAKDIEMRETMYADEDQGW